MKLLLLLITAISINYLCLTKKELGSVPLQLMFETQKQQIKMPKLLKRSSFMIQVKQKVTN